MGKEDLEFLLVSLTPIVVVIWMLIAFFVGFMKATVEVSVALLSAFAIGAYFCFITKWWFEHRDKKQ